MQLVLHEHKGSEKYKMDDPDTVIQEHSSVTNLVLFLDKLNSHFSKILSATSLNDLFADAADILKETLNCSRVTFLMKNRQVINIFNEEDRGFGTNIYIDEHSFVIANCNRKTGKKSKILREDRISKWGDSAALFEPCFDDFDSAFYGRVLKKKM